MDQIITHNFDIFNDYLIQVEDGLSFTDRIEHSKSDLAPTPIIFATILVRILKNY